MHDIRDRTSNSPWQCVRLLERTILPVLTVAMLAALQTSPRGLHAQSPRVAGFDQHTFVIENATLVTAPNAEPVSGRLVLQDGRIVGLGSPKAPVGARVIDGQGLYCYAGFLDAANSAVLRDGERPDPGDGRTVDFGRYVLAATRPDNRKSVTPDYAGREAFDPSRDLRNQLRATGVTSVHAAPAGRVVSGTAALLALSDAPRREALLLPETVVVCELFAPGGSTYPSTLMGATAHLRQLLLDARHYRQHWQLYRQHSASVERPATDAALERMLELLEGHRTACFRVDSKDDVHRSLDFCEEFQLQPVLWARGDVSDALPRLRAEHVPVIVQLDFDDAPKPESLSGQLEAKTVAPQRVQDEHRERWKTHVRNIELLHAAGVNVAVSTAGLDKPAALLPRLRECVKAGLSPDTALAALTQNPARMLGIDDRLGTLAVGRLDHVVVLNGPLEHEKSQVRHVFVDGEHFEYHSDAKPVTPETDASPQATPVDLAGRWRLQIESKQKTTALLKLTQAGPRLSGTFESDSGNGAIRSGRVTDTSVEFEVEIGAGAQAVKLVFRGSVNPQQQLEGELESAFGAGTRWTGQRVGQAPQTTADAQGDTTADESQNPNDAEPKTPVAKTPPARDDAAAESPTKTPAWPTELRSDRMQWAERLGDAARRGGDLLIERATVLTGTGKTLKNTSILVHQGKIAAIGRNLQPEVSDEAKSDAALHIIDGRGSFVMPGIIDTHSHIMISGGVNEYTQSIVPEVRIKDVINSEDVSEYRALAGGVTIARLLHGSANVIGGQDAVVKLRHGRTAREHLMEGSHQGVKFALGENVKYRQSRFPNTRLGVEATLNRAFLEAIDYRRQWMAYQTQRKQAGAGDRKPLLPPRRDLRLEALAGIVNHEIFIHSHCYRADEILMLLRVASDLGIRVWSLQHVLEGYKIAPEIVAHGASCSTFSDWWAYKVEAYDATPYNAALLKEAGANVVIKSDDRELIRHLYVEAAKCVRYGNMPPEQALQTITLNAARELGIDNRVGSIEVGKDADLAVFNGHPLHAFARCEMTIIDGHVYFDRADAPTAMSAAQQKRSRRAPALAISPERVRTSKLDLPTSPEGKYAIVNARVVPVDEEPLEHATVLVSGGRITGVGSELSVPDDAVVIDATGLEVYPGLIDAGTTLGLTEIRKVTETQDTSESGGLQPDLRAGVAINPDSELFPVARAGGVTLALVHPTGGTICGQASLVQLDGWTARDMVERLEAGLWINWPRERDSKALKELQEFLDEAREYDRLVAAAAESGTAGPIGDPRFRALRPYLHAEKPVFIEADSRQQIAEALLFAEKEKLRIVICGGTDAWKLAEELKERDVPVIVGPVMRSPTESYDPADAPYANPGRLHEAGVQFCLRSDSASNSRNLPFEAAMAVSCGLPEQTALRAVTLAAAEILGLDQELGSIRVGKRANLIITDGSPLLQTTMIKGIFVNGRPHPPASRHTRLYERYRRRLHEVQGESAKDVAQSAN